MYIHLQWNVIANILDIGYKLAKVKQVLRTIICKVLRCGIGATVVDATFPACERFWNFKIKMIDMISLNT